MSRQGPKWRAWELEIELDLLIGTDTPESIATRLGYCSARSLARSLTKRRLNHHASRLLRGVPNGER